MMKNTIDMNDIESRITLIVWMRTKAEHFADCLEACELIHAPKELETLFDTIQTLERTARKNRESVPRWADRNRVKAFVNGTSVRNPEPKEFDQLIDSSDHIYARGLGIRLE